MVNTGHPSEACTRCRSRRVKCDAAKPSCGNCFKLGATCPGYPEPAGITFRDDTAKTQARAQRMYRNLQSRAEDESGDSGSESSGRRMSKSAKPTRQAAQATRSPEPSSSNKILVDSIEALSTKLGQRGFLPYIDRLHDAVSMYPSATGPLKTAVELLALSTVGIRSPESQYQMASMTERVKSDFLAQLNSAIEQLKHGSGSHEQVLLAVECFVYYQKTSLTDVEINVRAHFDGISAIVEHAGSSLLNSERGRNLYVTAFICHLDNYSPLTDLAPIPGPDDAVEILLQHISAYTPEYRSLPLLRHSFNLRRRALQLFVQSPERVTFQSVTEIKQATDLLRQEFENMWASLPAAQKFGGSSMGRSIMSAYWVQRILIEDTQIRCLRAMQQVQSRSNSYADEFEASISRARFAVRIACQGLPYTFSEADLPSPDEEPPSYLDVMFGWNGHMVDVLTEEQHAGISYARAASARASGLKQPMMTLPRILMKID